MKSAPTLRSMIALALLTSDAASTPPAATSASPIIRADAVAAVRRGLRRAFSRASRPIDPQRRGSTLPMPPTTGRLRNGLSIAAPRKMPSAPTPTHRMPALPTRPAAMPATPAARTDGAQRPPRRRSEEAGRATSSRIAATGGMCVARRAGATADATVTTTPRDVGPDHGVGLEHEAVAGEVPEERARPGPAAPSTSSTPSPSPMVDPSRPDDEGLDEHGEVDLPPAGAEGAQQRELAAALGDQHAERVEDDERARRRSR